MYSFHKRKGMVLLVLLCTAISRIPAQNIYHIPDLIHAAIQHMPVLQQKQAQLNSAKAAVTDTRHSFLPQVKLAEQISLGTDNSLAGAVFPMGIMPSASGGIRASNDMQSASGNSAVVYGEYELYNFGLKQAKLSTAGSYVHLQEADIAKEQYLIKLDIARLYFGLLKTQYRLLADQQNVKRYDSIFRVILALTRSGIRPGSDSSLAKAELSKARISLQQTKGAVAQYKEQLAYYTGIAAADLRIDSMPAKFSLQQPAPVIVSPDGSGNPLLDYYTRKKEVFASYDQLIRTSYRPKLILAGSVWARGSSIQYSDNYKSLPEGLGYQRFNYAAGVVITYSLFNGIHKRDKLTMNRFDKEAAEHELNQQQLALQYAQNRAGQQLQTTTANLSELPVQLQSAGDTYRQKLAQYKAGLISLIDLTNASFVLYRSQTDFIETLGDWYLAGLDKSAAAGTLDSFLQQIK
jgi:outer membrane protein TolC